MTLKSFEVLSIAVCRVQYTGCSAVLIGPAVNQLPVDLGFDEVWPAQQDTRLCDTDADAADDDNEYDDDHDDDLNCLKSINAIDVTKVTIRHQRVTLESNPESTQKAICWNTPTSLGHAKRKFYNCCGSILHPSIAFFSFFWPKADLLVGSSCLVSWLAEKE